MNQLHDENCYMPDEKQGEYLIGRNINIDSVDHFHSSLSFCYRSMEIVALLFLYIFSINKYERSYEVKKMKNTLFSSPLLS